MPDLTKDLVSVIVPIFNVEKYLDQALDSLENQSYKNLEIICINDGSTDSSLQIIQAHAAKDSRYVVIDRKNSGYGSGCNCGIDNSHGQWIAILEPDDWILPGMYKDMLDFGSGFDVIPDIIKTPYIRICFADTPEEKRYQCTYKGRINPKQQPFTLAEAPRLSRHHPSIWSAIYRKDFLIENGIRFHEIPGAGWADNPFLMDTLLRAQNIVYFDTPYYCYREDTPQKEAAFAKKCPGLPFERWHDMTDILEQLNVTDKGILTMHVDKGFMYRDGIVLHNDADDPKIIELETAMYKRMDPQIVMNDAYIAPSKRKRFAQLTGMGDVDVPKLPYYGAMFKEAVYQTRNNGIGYTLGMVKKMLRKLKR